jgi:uncharacterized damage-inducible protein DinB
MDRATLEELFDYTGWVWEQVGTVLASVDPRILTKEVDGSGWPALWDCLRHISFAYDIWIARLDGRPRLAFDPKPPDWPALDSFHQQARERLRVYQASLSDAALQTDRLVETYDEPLAYTPAEVLGNVLWHERGHHGDVSTLLYQLGLAEEMPMIDYRFYVSATK